MSEGTELFFEGEEEELVAAIPHLASRVGMNRLLTSVREAAFPSALSVAVQLLVRQAVVEPWRGEPIRSQGDLALEVGCSERHLRRVAGPGLAELLDLSLASRAYRLKCASPELTWERVALQLGYHSGSGLTELFKRVLDTTPSRLSGTPAEELRAKISTALGRLSDSV